ncbi:Uncharacterized protein OBRU01_27089, partial [Operophtera brumata]
PIELSHYPSAYKPPPGTKSKIERDDFPAPPYPYTDPERRRRWSDTYKGVPESDDEADAPARLNGHVNGHRDQLRREERELAKIHSGMGQQSDDEADAPARLNGHVNGHRDQLRREERELAKIHSGMGQVFLKEVKEREKLEQWKKQNLDPRNASRTPSASREVMPRLRYSSPVGASPSRHLDHPRPALDDTYDTH